MTTTVASDNFNRADGGLGSNWTTVSGLGAPAIVSNRVQNSGGAVGAIWSGAGSFDSTKQFASIELTDISEENNQVAVWIHAVPATGVGYLGVANFNAFAGEVDFIIYEMPGFNLVASSGAGFSYSIGDIYALSRDGDGILEMKQNGITRASNTDTTITGGKPGVYSVGGDFGSTSGFDNWEGGDANALITGTGVLTAQAATASGSGARASSGEGVLSSASATASGSGARVSAGTGALASNSAIAGTGLMTLLATGNLQAQNATISSSGIVLNQTVGNAGESCVQSVRKLVSFIPTNIPKDYPNNRVPSTGAL